MVRFFTLVAILLATFLSNNVFAWNKVVKGNGNITKQIREVHEFNGIKASAGIDVYLFQGNEEKVVVEADENIQECIITKVKDGVLRCYVDCTVRKAKTMKVFVNFDDLNMIKASSGSDVFGETLIQSNNLELDASSAADIKVEVDAEFVDCDASSGADIFVKGNTEKLSANASSGADINAKELNAKECRASASSGGDVKVTASETLDASASSGGDVSYSGNPRIIDIDESSGGDVKRR